MRRHDVRVRPQSSATRVLEWAGLSAADLEECTHRPAEYNTEERRRMHEDPAPCARCAEGGTSFPQLLDTGPETGLRWLPLCAACTDGHLAHGWSIVDRMYGPSRARMPW